MSTKLYSGLRLKDPETDIFELVPRIAAALRPAFEESIRELVALELLSQIDRRHSGLVESEPRDPDSLVVFDVEQNWLKAQRDFGSHHTLNDPLRFSMVFGRSSAGSILAYPYYREPRYGDALESLELFEDYHYQDNADRPEEISKKDWKKRAEEWDSIANSAGTLGDLPSWELGNTMGPFSEIYMLDGPFDANSYLDPDRRLARALEAELSRRLIAGRELQRNELFSLIGDASRAISRFRKTEEFARVAHLEPVPLGLSFSYRDLAAPYSADSSLMEMLLSSIEK